MTSDNGPQLSSEEFWKFTETWSIETKPRVQDIHRRMVMSEKVIQTAKRIMAKTLDSRSDTYLVLLEHRIIPVDGFKSPAQLSMNRQLLFILPVVPQALLPKYTNPVGIEQIRRNAQKIQQMYYNIPAKDLSSIAAGEKMWVKLQENRRRKKAVVTEQLPYSSRSYTVDLITVVRLGAIADLSA